MSFAFSARAAALVSLALFAATPALAAGNAANGLLTLKEFSVLSLGNAKLSQEVGGKTWIGGNLTGAGGQFGFGTNNAQGYVAPAVGAKPTLSVGGDVTVSNLNIQNGAAPGGPGGKVGPVGLVVGGTITGGNLNFNASGGVSQVGALSNVNANLNGGTFTYGAKSGGNLNANGGAVVTQNANLNPGLKTSLATQTATYSADLKALSTSLFGMATDSAINAANANDVKFVGTPGADGVSVFNITDAASFFSQAAAFNFDGVSSSTAVIVNVSSLANITLLNIHQNWVSDNATSADAFSQKVIWNFASSIQNIDFGQFDGSILAVNSNVSSSAGFIQGSVAAAAMVRDGGAGGLNSEVHLGTFGGTGIPFGVPEPATWTMLLIGFAGLGAMLRRQRRALAA